MWKAVVGGAGASYRLLVSGKLLHLIVFAVLVPFMSRSSYKRNCDILSQQFWKVELFPGCSCCNRGKIKQIPYG